jgi:hypothetical protein
VWYEERVILDAWLEKYQQIAQGNRSLLKAFEQLWGELDRNGIEVFPVKGIDLLLRGYPGFGLRPMADADILLRGRDVETVTRFLGSLGFRCQKSQALLSESFAEESLVFFSADNRLNLDVSWNLWYLDGDETLWERAALRQTSLGMRRLLHPEDALLYLIAYGVAHRGRLTPLFVQDLDALLSREGKEIDWERWCAQVKQIGMGAAIHHGLLYARRKGLGSLPGEVLTRLRPRGLCERSLAWFYSRAVTEQAPPRVSYLSLWLGTPGLRKKIQLLKRSFFPPTPYLELRRGGEPAWRWTLLRWIKPFWILVRGLYFIPRDLFRLCRG